MTKKILHPQAGLLLLLLVIMIGSYSCTSTLYVAPKRTDCTGVSDQQCYLIRYNPTGNWILHYQDIQGFDYEPGFSYKIKVKKEKIKNPPMDGSSLKYTLVDVVEKKDVTTDIALEDLVDKDWKLEYLKSNNIQYGIENNVPTLKFSTDGKVSGNGGCNNFFANFNLYGRTLTIGDIGSTRMMCEETMDLENAYFKVLSIELNELYLWI
jgi:heat shock protein HslJ